MSNESLASIKKLTLAEVDDETAHDLIASEHRNVYHSGLKTTNVFVRIWFDGFW